MSDSLIARGRRLSNSEKWMARCFGLAIAGLFLLDWLSEFSPVKWSVVLVVIFWVPLLVVHELGHVAVAKSVGFGVHRFVIGFGKPWLRGTLGGTRVVFRRFPLEGFIVPAPAGVGYLRLKLCLTYLGGPAAEVLVLMILVWTFGPRLRNCYNRWRSRRPLMGCS